MIALSLAAWATLALGYFPGRNELPQDLGSPTKIVVPTDVRVDPNTPQAWSMLTCAILFESNHERHDLLAGVALSEAAVTKLRERLEEWWDIQSREDLLATLDDLRANGHRATFEKLGRTYGRLSGKRLEQALGKLSGDELVDAQFAAREWKRLGKKSLIGWDLARYAALCRWGYGIGFLDEREAWERLLANARTLQKTFVSWDELHENYCLGREFWSPEYGAKARKLFDALRTAESKPWTATPWELALSASAPAPAKR